MLIWRSARENVKNQAKQPRNFNRQIGHRLRCQCESLRERQAEKHCQARLATRREAELYEAQIKLELQTGSAAMVGYGPESKQKLKEYLPKWYESYHHNLAKSTRYSYWSGINIHLIPMLGEVSLNKLTPQMIDDMIAQLREKGLAENSVRYCHRILSSALSSAVKYGYIPNNPAKNIMTRFSKERRAQI